MYTSLLVFTFFHIFILNLKSNFNIKLSKRKAFCLSEDPFIIIVYHNFKIYLIFF